MPTLSYVYLGVPDDALNALLADVCADMGVCLAAVSPGSGHPDLVIATVQRSEAGGVLAAARAAAAGAPIIALLPFSDERLARTALDGGARACFALDTPLAALRRAMTLALAGGPRGDHLPAGRRS